MSAKIGRPPIENPKNVRLEIRLTQKEDEDIRFCAEQLNITRTEALIKGIQLVKAELNKK